MKNRRLKVLILTLFIMITEVFAMAATVIRMKSAITSLPWASRRLCRFSTETKGPLPRQRAAASKLEPHSCRHKHR